ncbi:hypothetical protein K2173_005183 [Erythroxylum novogranatense]|uniref:ERCC4 domain-containing protein n=1 Tax=Erythroxylum novogranatense TaxID=1862640 RepID=A0AAV8TTL6_9ROSI|nr:hypothetical protein K2173_005183 [Erythroxylum novogranatense]
MSTDPIIVSDEEGYADDYNRTPLPSVSKKLRSDRAAIPTVFVIDDDPTPQKHPPTAVADSSPSSLPSVVPETPLSDLSIVKCTYAASIPDVRVSIPDKRFFESDRLVCVDSENDEREIDCEYKDNRAASGGGNDGAQEIHRSSRFSSSVDLVVGSANLTEIFSEEASAAEQAFVQDRMNQVHDYSDKENFTMDYFSDKEKQKRRAKVNSVKKISCDEAVVKKRISKEEKLQLMEEKKLKKEQEKLQKAALKAQAAELKKMEKEKQKWEKGKFALKSIVAEFDAKVVEQGAVGGHLLTRFADKGLTYRVTSNPIKKSILWTMNVPDHISQLSSEGTEIRYVVLVYEAEEFCSLVTSEALLDHVAKVQSHYPSYTVCCLTNRLMAYINKREKEQYKNPEDENGWRRPPVEEVLAKLTTHFVGVHYRQCRDEAELAEHVVGLTCSLASCQFRKKLTRLSVNANGSLIPKDCVDKNLIKRSPWLKALVAIPKVQPRFAIAIWKKYPTMKSLLKVYMDPKKSVHEKEFLLDDLMTEGLLGSDRRLGKICSKRVYRILMAQSGSIKTDDVEDGADLFEHQSS